jgi:predicted SPOUT superfamily RNA methylase MTH1
LIGKKVSIAIPASFVSDIPHLREKTLRVGLIGRAAAIFRIEEIMIYLDDYKVDQLKDVVLITTLLSYMETPQYLRKRLFGLKHELRYAGILPPLRTPHHPLNRKVKDLQIGEYRDGVTLSKRKTGILVDVGIERPVLLVDSEVPIGERISVRITKTGDSVELKLAQKDEIPSYWGYTVTDGKSSFGKMVKARGFDLVVATSKHGRPFQEISKELGERWIKAETVLVGFGSPAQGLPEILKVENLKLENIADFVVNTVPKQGTETIRTEEAVISSLAVLNMQPFFKA